MGLPAFFLRPRLELGLKVVQNQLTISDNSSAQSTTVIRATVFNNGGPKAQSCEASIMFEGLTDYEQLYWNKLRRGKSGKAEYQPDLTTDIPKYSEVTCWIARRLVGNWTIENATTEAENVSHHLKVATSYNIRFAVRGEPSLANAWIAKVSIDQWGEATVTRPRRMV
jgi:hypothetical protein